MIILQGPVNFEMGSPQGEVGRGEDEVLHQRLIPRTFALSSKHITVGQFRLPASELKMSRDNNRVQGDDSEPLNYVRSSDALIYCNWLSKREGIPEDQWCYELKPDKLYLSAVDDCLERTGYRLPTEAEWEYACRAGAVTPYPWGTSVELSRNYAWSALNAGKSSWGVGLLCPNDFGFFDMLGSLRQWCHEQYRPYPDPGSDGLVLDNVYRSSSNEEDFLQRGGYYTLDLCRSAKRIRVDFIIDHRNSFRVARTIRNHPG